MNESAINFSFLAQLDDLCGEYELLFAGGESPRIEDFLARVQLAHRSVLVHRLVALDVTLRQERGEDLAVEEMVHQYVSLLPLGQDSDEALRSTIEHALISTEDVPVTTAAYDVGSGPDLLSIGLPQIHGFDIHSELGRGGMGVVYRATQTSLSRPVALKMILNDGDEYLDRFEKEAQAVADLNDPHFVQVYDFNDSSDRPYIVFELLEGGSLEKYRRSEPQPIAFSAETVEHLAKGMEKAHAAGLVHRDLKPGNVLLTSDGWPKIADFGLVKRVNQETQFTDRRRVGTVSYMAPEQTYGGPRVGPSADVYALGGILYCRLTGRPPFLASTVEDTILQVRNDDPVPPSRLRPDVPRDLETICLHCLEKEPEKRYLSAANLAEDLRRYLDGHAIMARPVSPAERTWRWAKRNPSVATLGTLVAGLLIAVTVGSWLFSWRLALRTSEAVAAREDAVEQGGIALDSLLELARGANDRLGRVPHPEARRLRDELLRTVLLRLDQVQKGTTNALIAASAYLRAGELLLMEGKNSEALAAMKKCQDNAEQMVHAPEYRDKPWVPLWNLARAEDGLGDTQLALRNRSEAKLHYEEGLGLRRKWLKLNQETSRAEEAVAISLARLGAFHRREDSELPTALDYYQQCLELRRKLHEGHVDDPRIQEPARMQFEYGGTLMSVGGVHKRLGERKEALEHLNAAIPHLRAALRKWQEEEAGFQDEYAAEGNIAITYGDIGELYLLSKDFHAAEASYVEAVNRLRKLHQSDVDQREIRRSLWKCLYGLGTVHLASSPDAAQEAFEEVLRLSPDKSVERAYALARCHLPDQAAVILAELKERYQASPNGLYYVACGYALCNWSIQHRSQGDELDTDSKAQLEFSDQAIATLRAAISGGYNNLAELEHNPELDSLRGHNDFVRLLAQLASSSGVANGQPLDR